ncbi:MAG: rubredoxin [Solirubrobacteraceae bacterium]
MRRWQCTACGYIYDERQGDPHGGFPAETRFEQIPDNWLCPDCGLHKKTGFEQIGLEPTELGQIY